jgi:D-3-phosphoglycerate dehydrogenase
MARILLTDHPWPDPDLERELVLAAGHELSVAKYSREESEEESLVRQAASCDAIVTCWAQVTPQVITSAGCRIVTRMGIGLDNIALQHCREHGVTVTNVPDYCIQEVAEHALASIFALARHIGGFHLATKAGVYDLSAAPPLRLIAGQTLGIIGMGRIGARLANLASAIGMRVIVASRRSVEGGWTQVPTSQLAAESDFLSLHLPLTETTRNLVDREFLQSMKPTAYLINTARGPIVDHDALANAIVSGTIAGAALDVQAAEPPDLSQPPYNHPQVIVTPHAAFVSESSLITLRKTAIQQTIDFLDNGTTQNVVS